MGNCLAIRGVSESSIAAQSGAPTQQPPLNLAPPPPPLAAESLQSLYIIGQELGRGESGVIRLCKSRNDQSLLLACKSIPNRAEYAARAREEARIMTLLSSSATSPPSSLVCLHHAFEDENHIHLVLDLCRGGDLYDRLARQTRFSEPTAAFIIYKLLQALRFCHELGIMHRDLKPENILLDSDSDSSATIKLADFGLAVHFTPGERFTEVAGSCYYMAPEMLRGDEYNEAVDVWSLGVIAYVLLSGWPPFGGHTEQAILNAIQKGKLTFHPPHIWSLISPSAIDLISSMLCLDTSSRCTISKALNHPWIVQHCCIQESETI